ncbi:MAG: SGNH/GDSL hydrolase family protein [Rhodococcus sp.]|nr:SGNH/GDSL hydrolase family protein [Rhodococcus sp. (in: high G+C Gram-positive bacteria)]
MALGDSFSNGIPILPLDLEQGSTPRCTPSLLNYPHLVAQELGAVSFDDETCGGAKTASFTSGEQPQYNALTPHTDLVTVGIGGNDMGLLSLGESCINFLPEGTPGTRSCADTATAHGGDLYSEKIVAFAPRYTQIVHEIRERSPHARIVFVGYPTAIRPGGCYPMQPMWARDADYIQARIDQINDVMRTTVTAAGAEYVSLRESTVGHDACAVGADRWLEGPIPSTIAAPLHPNQTGHANAAQQVLAHLR